MMSHFLSTMKVTLDVSALKSGQSVSPGTWGPFFERGVPCVSSAAVHVRWRLQESRGWGLLCFSLSLGSLAPALCHALLRPCPQPL